MLGRYLVFATNDRPQGGWRDFLGTYDSMEEIEYLVLAMSYRWYQVVDLGPEDRLEAVIIESQEPK